MPKKYVILMTTGTNDPSNFDRPGLAFHEPDLLDSAAADSLLLPLHADPGCSCASPLLAFLEETALCGVPGLLCAILYEGKHLTASPSAHARVGRRVFSC